MNQEKFIILEPGTQYFYNFIELQWRVGIRLTGSTFSDLCTNRSENIDAERKMCTTVR